MAQAGYEAGYLETLDITYDDAERGRGPTGTAIRTGEPAIARNIATDPAFAPWREEARRRGYGSSIALPLHGGRRMIGTLNIYAAEPEAFPLGGDAERDAEEVELLTDLTDELAYGILALRTRAQQAQAEEQLRLRSAALEAAANAVVITDRAGTIRWVNPAFTRLTGYSWDDAVGQTPRILKSGMHDDAFYRDMWETILAGEVWQGQLINRRADGSLYTEQQTITPIQNEAGEITHFIAIKEDISARVQRQAHRQAERRVLEMIATWAPLDDVLDFIARTAEEHLDGGLCSILVLDETEQQLWHRAAPRLPAEYVRAIDGLEIGPRADSCGTAAYRKEPVIVSDVAQDPLWEEYREVALAHDLRACWSIPIVASDETVLGTFAVYYHEPRSPTARDLQRMESAVHLAGIAVERERVEGARRRLAAILEETTDFVATADLDGNVLYYNRAARRMLGLSDDEDVSGIRAPDTHPEWAGRFVREEGIPTAIREGVWRGETAFLGPDGGEIPVSQVIVAHKASDGRASFLSTIARDITARVRREREREVIVTVTAALRGAETRAEMLPIILEQVLLLSEAKGVAIAMRDPASGDTIVELARGAWKNWNGVRLPPGEGVSGHLIQRCQQNVIETGRPYRSNDVRRDTRCARPDLIRDLHVVACVPLIARDRTIGALWMGREREITDEELRMLTAIGDMAASAIQRATLHEQTERRLQRLSALRAVDRAITGMTDLQLVLD